MSEPQEIVETRGDDRVDLLATDTNGDGKPDVWVSDTDGDGKADLFQFDTDGDGKVDITMVDLDEDGTPDTVVDGDGGLPPASRLTQPTGLSRRPERADGGPEHGDGEGRGEDRRGGAPPRTVAPGAIASGWPEGGRGCGAAAYLVAPAVQVGGAAAQLDRQPGLGALQSPYRRPGPQARPGRACQRAAARRDPDLSTRSSPR